ncbi:hypothetical protein BGZ60DRAFT_495855 [Tricladium varicosporioides]|nr:hypothetical protein BGZ60DRAFT_495855 [Hymenoscyphus varicosporioides]
MSKVVNVAIPGATGNLGTKILDALLKLRNFNVTAIKRVGSNAMVSAPVKVVEVNYESLEMLTAALEGQDVVICALGMGTDASVHNRLIDAAITAKVKRFIPSEFGLDSLNHLTRQLPVYENKLKILNHLEERALKSEITYSYVINSVFLDWGLQNNLILDMSQHKPTIFGSGDEAFSTTTMATAVKALVWILEHYDETKNRVIYVQDAVVTQNKLLAIAKKHSPGVIWEPVHVDLKKMKAESDAKFKQGACDMSTLYSFLLVAIFQEGYGGRLERTDNDILDIKEMTEVEIERMVKAYLPNN